METMERKCAFQMLVQKDGSNPPYWMCGMCAQAVSCKILICPFWQTLQAVSGKEKEADMARFNALAKELRDAVQAGHQHKGKR
jgi:hypothetical protein